MSKRLQAASHKAKMAGLSKRKGPKKVKAPCTIAKQTAAPASVSWPEKAKSKETHQYEECILKKLDVNLSNGSKSQAITLSNQRRNEAVQQSVADEYKTTLKSVDLVIEAVSSIDIKNNSTHLRVTAQASNSAQHTSWTPLHPHTEIGAKAAADSGALVKSEFPVPYRTGIQNWLAIWPFKSQRTQFATINGEACGHAKPSGKGPMAPLKNLSIQLVVFPEEQWTFSIKSPKLFGKSKTATGDIKRQGGAGSGVWASKTVTVKTESGFSSKSTSSTTNAAKQYQSISETLTGYRSSSSYTSEKKGDSYNKETLSTVDRKGQGQTITETTKNGTYSETKSHSQRTDYIIPIGSTTYSISQTESTEKGFENLESETKLKASDKISLQVTSAGETASFEPGKFVENLYTIYDIIKDIGELFSAVKVGWSISYDISILEGNLDLGWGLRWPANYHESNRIWYVERYISIGGNIKLVEGSIAASVGINFDIGWLPAGVVAEIAASLKLGLHLAPSWNVVYTNWKEDVKDREWDVSLKFEITLSATATGSARVVGFSRVLKGSADAKFSAVGKLALSTIRPPSLTASIKFDGLTLTGYFESSARDPVRAYMEPIKLLEPAEIMKEREFWN
jgi:hypothetical protein